jgi:hypothetical protein
MSPNRLRMWHCRGRHCGLVFLRPLSEPGPEPCPVCHTADPAPREVRLNGAVTQDYSLELLDTEPGQKHGN